MILAYSREAGERIRSLPPDVKHQMREALEDLLENPYAGKPLQRELAGFWTLAVMRYRVLYKPLFEERRILIYTVGRRETVYEDFRKGLKKGR